MTDPETPILDEGVLSELLASVDDDRSFVAELVTTYLSDGAEHVERLAEAIAASDHDAIVRPAHTLKSSSATVGALRLAATARSLESAGRDGRLDHARSADAATLRDEWEAAAAALRTWIARSEA